MEYKKITPLDRVVAKNLMNTRLEKGLTRLNVAKDSGETHQQWKDYEGAATPISASKLFEHATRIGVDIREFFQVSSKDVLEDLPAQDRSVAKIVAIKVNKLSDEDKKIVLDMVESLAKKTKQEG